MRRTKHKRRRPVKLLRGEAQDRQSEAGERRKIESISEAIRAGRKAGDMRSADQLAERAHILAKELQSGK
jgi:hypothetical protein